MGRYVNVLLELPKTYGKLSRDAACSVDELLARAASLPQEARGLSGATINRHLTQIGELVAYAASQGINPSSPISLTGLRAKKKTRDRDERAPFEPADRAAIFNQPVWRGCESERRRLKRGRSIVYDGLFWAPLIANYALMRREEICGLMIADVVFDGAVPFLDIRNNDFLGYGRYPRLLIRP